jgi:hypothetical protein
VEKCGTAKQATDDSIILRMRFACRIIKATDTHTVYVILIAFPRQLRLCERVSILRYIYIASLLSNKHFPLRPTLIPNTTKHTTCDIRLYGGIPEVKTAVAETSRVTGSDVASLG